LSAQRQQLEVSLEAERAALDVARSAKVTKIAKLETISGGGADAYADFLIDATVRNTINSLQKELVVFGRIDDTQPWRIGLYGIDLNYEQLVVDWRAPLAEGFYQATAAEPRGLTQRVSYVGCIDELMIEDFVDGGISGSSPLFTELSRSRGTEMRAAVATLQSEQDRLVRLPPGERLVLRGGPGTGKTVVALHRAAWILYSDRRLASYHLLVLGPSDRFLRYVSAVLPTLGEARIAQTTFERHLGPSTDIGRDERWVEWLDRFEETLPQPARVSAKGQSVSSDEVAEIAARAVKLKLPWRDRRKTFASMMASRLDMSAATIAKQTDPIFPAVTAKGAWSKLRNPATLERLGVEPSFIAAWRKTKHDGPLFDEIRARFEGVPTRYSHVVVDEAQDMTLLEFRAVMRRADGLTLVGDDAQRSAPGSLGLKRVAEMLGKPLEQMATAYRMSAEIADWLNNHATTHNIDAVQLLGIRPNAIAVQHTTDFLAAEADMRARWTNVAVIDASDVWIHKGVEYDAVVVITAGMTPAEIYLSASRAAHQLVIVNPT
jgi:DNA helicase IV